MTFKFRRSFYPPFPEDSEEIQQKYKTRFCERLVDFNEHIGITNCNDLFCIFDMNKADSGVWIRTSRGSVLCLQVFETSAYWAGQEGILYHFKSDFKGQKKEVAILNVEDVQECYQTRFQDSITSVSVRDDRILLGDVNAEIHCLDRTPEVPLSQNSFRFFLESGHSYKSYIWAVEMDDSRIFSGDSDACLVVHDFWNLQKKKELEDGLPPNKKARSEEEES